MTRLLLAVGLIAMLGITTGCGPQSEARQPGVGAQAASRGAVGTKYVYITFDDGPGPTYTPQILAILRRYGVKATFFEIGQNVRKYPAVTRKVHQQGHSVQNHTYSHPDLRKVPAATFRSQVQSADRYIRAQTKSQPRCLRPPYGGVNTTVRRRAAALGKTIKLWTVDPRDWSRPGAKVISRRVLASVRNGSTILLHDGGGNRSQTVAALPTILRTLKARGYTFRLVSCSGH
ncbi:polysaccharide deacetylase family protein [Kribbella sp. NPDC051620]|uniref:polysaccharide deacetylase family protein n=1 Tax=Kribbella sp. NPDC051620 TaxID=3364120 RepID=UPI0037BBDFC4